MSEGEVSSPQRCVVLYIIFYMYCSWESRRYEKYPESQCLIRLYCMQSNLNGSTVSVVGLPGAVWTMEHTLVNDLS